MLKRDDEVKVLNVYTPLGVLPSVQLVGPIPIITQQTFPSFPYHYLKEKKYVRNESKAILTESLAPLVAKVWEPSPNAQLIK